MIGVIEVIAMNVLAFLVAFWAVEILVLAWMMSQDIIVAGVIVGAIGLMLASGAVQLFNSGYMATTLTGALIPLTVVMLVLVAQSIQQRRPLHVPASWL